MPVAVPTGEYELKAAIDLSPVFGEIEHECAVPVTTPPENVLDRRLEQLASDDPNVRRIAVIDLRYFPGHGDRVFPALLGALDDEEPAVRSIALSVMISYPAQAAAHADVYLEILLGDRAAAEKATAAYLVGRFAPASPEAEAALTKAIDDAPEAYRPRFESALNQYRSRTGPEER